MSKEKNNEWKCGIFVVCFIILLIFLLGSVGKAITNGDSTIKVDILLFIGLALSSICVIFCFYKLCKHFKDSGRENGNRR